MNQSLTTSCKLSLLILVLASAMSAKAYAVDVKSFFKRSDQQAIELLEQGQHEQATALFKNPQWRGVSQYRAGNYEEALNEFNQLEDTDDEISSLYNRGTAAARAGDYDLAVSSLEQALENNPDNDDIRHNLDIARKLKELAEQNQQQQSSGDQNQDEQDAESDDGDQSQSQQEQNQQDQNQQNNNSQSDDASSEQGQQGDQSEAGDQQQSGELSADANSSNSENEESDSEDASQSGELSELQRELESERESLEASQQESPSDSDGDETGSAAYADTSLSEDDQATEQWLRRIPDDASQLLRNKIRLNHMIEYPDVGHMPESW